MAIDVKMIARIRELTGAGMMNVKEALEEAGGDEQKAIDLLRKKGAAKAAKRAGKVAAEGRVESYIHGEGRVGVLVEVNCETDFVAKSDPFIELVRDVAMHIAAAAPRFVTREEVSQDELDRERDVYAEQLKTEGKPADMIEKIVEGKMAKYYGEVCLMEQKFIKDEDKTLEQLFAEKTAEIGEKMTIRRFARYELGEGIEKEQTDYLKEVEEAMNV